MFCDRMQSSREAGRVLVLTVCTLIHSCSELLQSYEYSLIELRRRQTQSLETGPLPGRKNQAFLERIAMLLIQNIDTAFAV